ncbi:MAG: hypothetical protein KatS3mg011_0270 [Acidimicrobiia bacterium]|nr:MAG: hypothetical protein KatS3mg011_0270 [Acidimicrobiia bacterium]
MLGSVFLGGQVFEFTEFVVEHGMTLTTNPAASSFYVLTGFHGTHVAIGVLMLLSLFGISLRQGGLSERRGLNLELVGLYWHSRRHHLDRHLHPRLPVVSGVRPWPRTPDTTTIPPPDSTCRSPSSWR